MSGWNNMWANGIIGLASPTSSGASDIIRRETRNGALLSNTSFSYNYTGNRVWAYVHDIDPSTGNIVFGFWQNYSSASGNFNIIAFNWSGVKIADFVISNPPWPTGLAISNDSIYFSSANDTNGPGASGGYVSRYTFGGAVVWSRTDMPTYCRWNVRLANSGTGPSGSISTSFDGKVVYVVRSTYRGGSAKAGEICALDASSGSRAGGGRVALQGDYVRFTSKNVDNTFCMNAIFDTGGAASVARFNKNAELLELSSGWSGTYNDYCILRADNKVITIYKRNAPYYFYTYIQYPASPSQWQILE